jgi:hypothetical protein
METYHITHYSSDRNQQAFNEFEDALHHSMLRYSLRHLALTGITSQENALNALQKSIQVCSLAGVNSKLHFKQIYVFDANTKELDKDWLMSKKGFTIMLMQYPLLNENIARWLWNLSDL